MEKYFNSLCLPVLLIAFVMLATSPVSYGEEKGPQLQVLPIADADWQNLNPARGDESPQAATLWGDRNGKKPTGLLAKFTKGFSSPPHTHNAAYRAVVIEGLIHNDDPSAAKMWMPPGSFRTQPKGEPHITAAKNESNLALVEIDMGPYLVMPAEDQFDSRERPVNIVTDNIVWATPQGFDLSGGDPKIAYLWGQLDAGGPNGTFLKIPKGSHVNILSKGKFEHKLSARHQSILYIRTQGAYKLTEGNIGH